MEIKYKDTCGKCPLQEKCNLIKMCIETACTLNKKYRVEIKPKEKSEHSVCFNADEEFEKTKD